MSLIELPTLPLFPTAPAVNRARVAAAASADRPEPPDYRLSSPRRLAEEIAREACIEPHHRVLEPSAGPGHLALALLNQNPADVVAIERHPQAAITLRMIARARPLLRVFEGDFLEVAKDPDVAFFDRIVMVPPLDESSATHVMAAWPLLAPNGLLLAVCPASLLAATTPLSTEFTHWWRTRAQRGARKRLLPSDAFGASVSIGTMLLSIPAD